MNTLQLKLVLDEEESSNNQKMTKSHPSTGSDIVNIIIKRVQYGCLVGSLLYRGQDIKWQIKWFDLLVKLPGKLRYTINIMF
jgi:hypothetical protein